VNKETGLFTRKNSKVEDQFRLARTVYSQYPIEDSKITCRLLFYPFGLVTVRFRTYLRFNKHIQIKQFIDIVNQISSNICRINIKDGAYVPIQKSVFRYIFEHFLSNAFPSPDPLRDKKGNIPDKYWGILGSIKEYPIIYIYDDTSLSDAEIAKLLILEQRSLSDKYIDRISVPSFGQFENDTIIVHKQGTVLQTPYFSEISSRNRRWKRIQLLNNAYLTTELMTFERDFAQNYIDILQSTLDALSTGTVTGVPIKPKYLVLMHESLRLSSRFRGIRSRMYEEIEPNSKEQHMRQISEYTRRIIDHSSILKETISTLAPGLLL
jgi:hypothetical protein